MRCRSLNQYPIVISLVYVLVNVINIVIIGIGLHLIILLVLFPLWFHGTGIIRILFVESSLKSIFSIYVDMVKQCVYINVVYVIPNKISATCDTCLCK